MYTKIEPTNTVATFTKANEHNTHSVKSTEFF